MNLAHLQFAEEEVVALRRAGDTLRLELRWGWEELPCLLDLPPRSTLRWGHLDDTQAGIPVAFEGWAWLSRGAENEHHLPLVELRLRLLRPAP